MVCLERMEDFFAVNKVNNIFTLPLALAVIAFQKKKFDFYNEDTMAYRGFKEKFYA